MPLPLPSSSLSSTLSSLPVGHFALIQQELRRAALCSLCQLCQLCYVGICVIRMYVMSVCKYVVCGVLYGLLCGCECCMSVACVYMYCMYYIVWAYMYAVGLYMCCVGIYEHCVLWVCICVGMLCGQVCLLYGCVCCVGMCVVNVCVYCIVWVWMLCGCELRGLCAGLTHRPCSRRHKISLPSITLFSASTGVSR